MTCSAKRPNRWCARTHVCVCVCVRVRVRVRVRAVLQNKPQTH